MLKVIKNSHSERASESTGPSQNAALWKTTPAATNTLALSKIASSK